MYLQILGNAGDIYRYKTESNFAGTTFENSLLDFKSHPNSGVLKGDNLGACMGVAMRSY